MVSISIAPVFLKERPLFNAATVLLGLAIGLVLIGVTALARYYFYDQISIINIFFMIFLVPRIASYIICPDVVIFPFGDHIDAHTINTQCKRAGATLAQIHFEAPQSLFDALELPYLRVVRAKSANDIKKYADEYHLVDAYCEAYGGVGKRLNIEWFQGIDCSKIILAGGLTPENITDLHSYGFYALDVSSGVEISKGQKDPDKVRRFVTRAKT